MQVFVSRVPVVAAFIHISISGDYSSPRKYGVGFGFHKSKVALCDERGKGPF